MLCGRHLTTPTDCYHCALDQWNARFEMRFENEKEYKGFLGFFPQSPETPSFWGRLFRWRPW